MSMLSRYQELVQDYKWAPQFVIWSFLAAVAACLDRRCFVNEQGLGYLYPNLYVVLVGPPATRKTTTAKLPMDLFLRTLPAGPLLSSNMLTPAVLIDELQEAYKTRGVTTGTAPLFAFSGEFGVLLKDIGGGEIIDLLLDFYDTRKPGEIWRKTTKKWGKQEIPNPALTLLGCTTPKEIRESGLSGTAGLGFTSRVIFICEPHAVLGTLSFPPLREPLVIELRNEFARLTALRGEFHFMNGAHAEIARVQTLANEWAMSNNGTSLFASYMARKPLQIRKVSMLFSAMRSNDRLVKGDDILAAEALVNEAEKTLLYAFGSRIVYKDANLMQSILDKLPVGIALPESSLLASFMLDGQAVPDNYEFRDCIGGLVRMKLVEFKVIDGQSTWKRLK